MSSLDKMLEWLPHTSREWIELIIMTVLLWLLMMAIFELELGSSVADSSHLNLANNRFASACVSLRPTISYSPLRLSPPPARTQIWPTMHLLTLERVGCRITVISW
jgi:hypothetical protein